jgi:hypothetical protein
MERGKAKGYGNHSTEMSLRANTQTTSSTAGASSHGKMDRSIKASLKTTSVMA